MAILLIELWPSIFDHLELIDLFSCALVSKEFYLAVKEYRVKELAFTRRTKTRWFHSDLSIYQHQIDYSMAFLLKRSSFNFDFLKRLKIGRLSWIDLNVINKFKQLEELDIDLKNYEYRENKTLSLANLKVLFVFISGRIPFLELDTPRLAKVCTFSLKRLDFFHPESIRCIHTFFHNRKLSAFRNLEFLRFTNYYTRLDLASCDPLTFKEFSLSNVKRLKEIDFYFTYNFTKTQFQVESLHNFRRIIEKILDLKRPNLKVFWRSVQITNTDLLAEYSGKCVAKLAVFQFKHLDKLKDRVHFFWAYDFNVSTEKLQKAGFDPRSEEFIAKFFARYSLRKLIVSKHVNDPKLLLEFIARSVCLFSMDFSDSGLDQTFFDRMAEIIHSKRMPLQSLRFKETSNNSLNFDFVIRLLDLELFTTDQQLTADTISKLLGLPLLVEIGFSSGEHTIERTSTGRFCLNGKVLSLQEILNIFDSESCSNIHRAIMCASSECSLM